MSSLVKNQRTNVASTRPIHHALSRNNHKHSQTTKLILKGPILAAYVLSLLGILLLLINQQTFNLSRDDAPPINSVPQPDRIMPQQSKKLNPKDFPLWEGWPTDEVPRLRGRFPLTGAFRYPGVDAQYVEIPQGQSLLFFPANDLESLLFHDEASDVSMEAYLQNRRNHNLRTTKSTQEDISLPPANVTTDLPAASFPDHALLTRCGFKGPGNAKVNQDRALLLTLPGVLDPSHTNDFIMALLDGHGSEGHVVSHFVGLQLPKRLLARIMNHGNSQEEDISVALQETFMELERDVVTPQVGNVAGSTAIVFVRQGDRLYIANTGDSLALVASYDRITDQVEILYETQPHKPLLEKERARIEAAGGKVQEPISDEDVARVLVPSGDQIYALAMSRSIGDLDGVKVGVISEPTVDALDLRELSLQGTKELFGVVASDGLWDHLDKQTVALHLGRSLYGSTAVSTLEACEQLIMEASRLWIAEGIPYRDDITIAVNKLTVA